MRIKTRSKLISKSEQAKVTKVAGRLGRAGPDGPIERANHLA